MKGIDTVQRNKFYHCLEYDHDQEGDLCLVASGMEHCDPGVTYGPERRDCWHLHVIRSGKGELCVGGKVFEPEAGQMFLLKDNEVVKYTASPSNPWNYCWVTYCGSRAKEISEMIGFTDGVYCLDSSVEARKFFELVMEMHGSPEMNLMSDLRRRSVLLSFLALAMQATETPERRLERRYEYAPEVYVQKAVDFIHYNYATMTITDLMEYIGFTRSYFSTLFKKYKNISPKEYLMKYRIGKSCELLSSTGLPINVIAAQVGYEDPLNFSRAFKKHCGESPTEYRNRTNTN